MVARAEARASRKASKHYFYTSACKHLPAILTLLPAGVKLHRAHVRALHTWFRLLDYRRTAYRPRRLPGETKMPEPIMVPTTRATPLNSPTYTIKDDLNKLVFEKAPKFKTFVYRLEKETSDKTECKRNLTARTGFRLGSGLAGIIVKRS